MLYMYNDIDMEVIRMNKKHNKAETVESII